MVDKHGYRKDFDWAIVERGIDGRSSLLKKMGGLKMDTTGQRSRKMSLTGGVGERGVKRSVGFQRSAMAGEGAEILEERSSTEIVSEKAGQENEEDSDESSDAEDFRVTSPVSPPSKANGPTSPSTDSAEDLVKSMSALRFVPPSVRRKQKTASMVRQV